MIVLLVVVSMPTVLFFALNSKWVQNAVVQRVAEALSDHLGNHITMSDIRISRFNKVVIHDLLVTDIHGDTILSTPELIGRLGLFTFSSRNIDIHKVVFNRADIRFAIDPEEGIINIKFIVDQLKSKDTTSNKPQWVFGIQAIELNDCRFSFKNVEKPCDRPLGMDYADLDVTNLNLVISDFHPDDSIGGVKFRIRRLSCVEKCGLDVKLLSADFAVNRNNLLFKNVQIVTSFSELQAKDISFHFNSFQDFGGENNFISKVMMNVDIQSSDVAFADLSQFVPYFETYSDKVMVAGKVTGTVEKLKGEKMTVHFGDLTQINGNFDLRGLPDIRSTLIYADITDLATCPPDIERIRIPRSPTGHVNLPPTIHQFSTIGFKGNFTGFFDDFVTYGTFATNLGNLSTDLSIKPITDTTFNLRGALKTEQFHLGELLMQPSIGRMTMSGMVEGSATVKGSLYVQIEGQIGSIDLRGYEYRNIAINGAVNNRMYDGKLSISEPNIKMDFSGKVDMTNPIPSYDFWANVARAKLHNLKLVEKDTSSFAAFKITATFSGTNIDNLKGDLKLDSSLFRRNSREIEINKLELFTKSIRDTNRFILLSDILDAEIRGQYQFLKLPESFFSMVKNFAPAWVPASVSADSLSHNNFRFEAKFKDTQKLTNFFVKEFRVARNTQIDGVYNPAQRDIHFVLDVPSMTLGKKRWRGFYVNGSVEDSTYVIESGCEVFRVNNNMSFEHLNVTAKMRGDSVALDLHWNNWDSVLNRGSISSHIFFQKKPKQKIPMMHIFSSPGRIVTAGDVWTLTHKGISIDSTSVRLNDFRAIKDDQEILVSGAVSQKEQDKLGITVKNLDLSVVNTSMQFDKLLFGGIVDGSASLSNLYEVPVFVSDIHIDDFSLNDSQLGNTDLTASWNSSNRSVRIEAKSLLNDLPTMDINGNYFTSDQILDFDVSLQEIPVTILQPYLENIFTGLEGTLSSKMKLSGALNNPLLNGAIDIHQAALTLDYTKTRYHFSGTTTVKDNTILFKNFDLFDRNNNLCKITEGSISFIHLKNIAFDLLFNASNLEVLNTGVRDNDLFYGRAFATGDIHIRGVPQDIYLDIKARTERNTQFNIPLSSSDEVAKTSFITFVDHTPRPQKRPREPRWRSVVSTNEPAPEPKFTININMDVRPDAEVQLIFDATIGDIMRARGSGNLMMNIADNRFDMRGTYVVEDGDYLFTLRNYLITAKKFTIENGGIITWNGDPMGALINLKAIYTVRTSLYNLMNDERFRQQSVPVECVMHLTNRLTNPNIRVELDIPNADQDVRSFLNATTKSEEEMARQFLSLLIINRFITDPSQSTTGGTSGSQLETMGLVTATEFFTSQLSHMISQMSDNFDFEIQLRPGTYETGTNIGGGIRGKNFGFHVDYDVAAENSENTVGDFTFDFQIPKIEKLRAKVFRRTNARYLSQNPYTQGVGLVFRKDFNNMKDLFKREKTPAIRREEEEPQQE